VGVLVGSTGQVALAEKTSGAASDATAMAAAGSAAATSPDATSSTTTGDGNGKSGATSDVAAVSLEAAMQLQDANATSVSEFTVDATCTYNADDVKGATTQILTFGKSDVARESLTNNRVVTKRFASSFVFAKAGYYEFTITQEVPAAAKDGIYQGIVYDTSTYYAVVTVRENATTGRLEASVRYLNSEFDQLNTRPIFVNRAASAQDEVTVNSITARATLAGRAWVSSDAFSFELAAYNASSAKKTGEVVARATQASEDAPATFDALTFTAPGTYRYVLTETGSVNPVTQPTTRVVVTVTVTRDATGALAASVTYATEDSTTITGTPTFANTYVAQDAHVDLNVETILAGREWYASDRFTYELAATTAGAPLPAATTASVTQATAPIINFNTLSFSAAGTYIYTIRELAGDITNMDYSTAVWTVTITVYDDPTAGELKATIAYDGDTSANWATFTNTFHYDPVYVDNAQAQVELRGHAWESDDVFAVAVYDEKTSKLINVQYATAEHRTVTFIKYEFTEPGTYTFLMKEIAGSLTGIIYDSQVWRSTVVVTPHEDGTLTAELSYERLDSATSEVVTDTTAEKSDEVTGAYAYATFVNVYQDPTTAGATSTDDKTGASTDDTATGTTSGDDKTGTSADDTTTGTTSGDDKTGDKTGETGDKTGATTDDKTSDKTTDATTVTTTSDKKDDQSGDKTSDITVHKGVDNQTSHKVASSTEAVKALPQTGDYTFISAVGGIALIGLVLIALGFDLSLRKRHSA
jgi:pilin isopeptide linkage protein